MKVLGIFPMAIGDIEPDKASIRHARKSSVVRDIAADIPAIGILNSIIARKVEGTAVHRHPILAGRRRYAAALQAGLKKIDVKLVECSDLEAEMICKAENGSRNHDLKERERITPELVELRRQILEAENGKATPADAKRAIALDRGISPLSVDKTLGRERKRRKKKDSGPGNGLSALAPSAPGESGTGQAAGAGPIGSPAASSGFDEEPTDTIPPPEDSDPTGAFPPFDLKGQAVEEAFLTYIEGLRQDLDDVELYARRCAEALERIGQRKDPMLEPLKGAENMTRQLQQTAQSLVPMSLCDCMLSDSAGCDKCHGNCWLP